MVNFSKGPFKMHCHDEFGKEPDFRAEHCETYYQCEHHEGYLMHCPHHHQFDWKAKECYEDHHVKCQEQRHNTHNVHDVSILILFVYILDTLCIVLYCIVLYCIVLSCIVLSCIALHCIVLYCIVLHCIVLYCIVLYCIVLYCIVLFIEYLLLYYEY